MTPATIRARGCNSQLHLAHVLLQPDSGTVWRAARSATWIGVLVAGLNKLAQSDVLDRFGLRKQAETTVFTVTRGGFKAATNAGRTFARRGKRGAGGTHAVATRPRGVFDLTPTEDEQMLVDVVTEFATEVVRPAAADADTACAAPDELLKASLEIGLPILGVPEALGGIAEERSATAGALVAEALSRGDMGLAVSALAPGAVATALGPGGPTSADLPACLHRGRRPAWRRCAERAMVPLLLSASV